MARAHRPDRARPRPYRRLLAGTTDTVAEARALLAEGWRWGTLPARPLAPPLPWGGLETRSRSAEFHLQSWTPLDTMLAAHERVGDAALLERAVAVALDWSRAHLVETPRSSFAWYDMAAGVRAYVLAFLLDRLPPDAEARRRLAGCARAHARFLDDDATFARHSNHGLFQAAGLTALGVLAADVVGPEVATRGTARVHEMADAQFTAEGVHREHSPGYHAMVLDALRAVAGLLPGDERLAALLPAAEDALAWLTLPDGTLAMFGDTDQVRPGEAIPIVTAQTGTAGDGVEQDARAFPASGYFVVRSRTAGGPGASYLAQACAFHSRTHKHADDLSFVWYDRGRPLLIDAGRYEYPARVPAGSPLLEDGFWYDDPRRIYVESTHAHNTVEVDGRSNRRTKVKPYGSALTRWAQSGEVWVVESDVRPHPGVRHARVLAFRPGTWLLVFDWLWDNTGAAHRFTQWFHAAPDLEPRREGTGVAATMPGAGVPLRAVSLVPEASLVPPVRGVTEPRLQGWWSPRRGVLEPAPAFGFERGGERGAVFATVLAFSAHLEPLHDQARVATSGRTAAFAWRGDDGTTTLRLRRPHTGAIELAVDAARP